VSQAVVACSRCSQLCFTTLQQDGQAVYVHRWRRRAAGSSQGSHPGIFPNLSLPPSVQNKVVPQCGHCGHVTSLPVMCVACNPHDWPRRINMVNSSSRHEAIGCYSSFIQLGYCSISSVFLKNKKVFQSQSLIDKKKETSMRLNAASASRVAQLVSFQNFFLWYCFLMEQTSFHGGGTASAHYVNTFRGSSRCVKTAVMEASLAERSPHLMTCFLPSFLSNSNRIT